MSQEMPVTVRYFVSLFYLSMLYLACDSANETLWKMPRIEANVTNDDVTGTQYASCKIATEEITANARATVTKVFTGDYKEKMIHEKFANLEKKLIEEFANVRMLLHNILDQHSDYLKNVQSPNLYEASDNYLSLRQDEIDKFNNTVQNLSIWNVSTSAFVYYWRVENFDEMLANWWTSRSVRSPTFHAGQNGYAIYLRLTPKYFPDGTVFVGVGLTQGRYDSALAWPFPFKIRLEVLDHSPKDMREDRRSRIWDPATVCTEDFWGRPIGKDNPECVGLSVPRRIILSKLSSIWSRPYSRNTRYILNGSILIKLIVYL